MGIDILEERLPAYKKKAVTIVQVIKYNPKAWLNSKGSSYAARMPEAGMKIVAYDIQKLP